MGGNANWPCLGGSSAPPRGGDNLSVYVYLMIPKVCSLKPSNKAGNTINYNTIIIPCPIVIIIAIMITL